MFLTSFEGSRIDAKRGDHFLQAELPVLILETEPGLIFNPRREWDP